MWGCFDQMYLTAAAFAAVPAFMEPRTSALVNAIGILLGLMVTIGCFVGIELSMRSLAKRFRYDASGVLRTHTDPVIIAWMVLSLLWPLPCFLLGRLLVNTVTNLSMWRP